MTHLKPCLYCLFAAADFTCYRERNNLEKTPNLWVIALNSLPECHGRFSNILPAFLPRLVVLEHKMRTQTGSGVEVFQELLVAKETVRPRTRVSVRKKTRLGCKSGSGEAPGDRQGCGLGHPTGDCI